MRDHDAALDQAIREAAAILGDALVRLLFSNQTVRQVQFSPVAAGETGRG